MRLFKLVTPNGDIDWVITNSEASLTSDDVQDEDAKRWQVEQLHRELKQLTGIEKCQCRKQRAQRQPYCLLLSGMACHQNQSGCCRQNLVRACS
ncbi:MAG: transposase [Anaerolineae bacterium]|nr:transposase [Anaerolineae bacterium]